MVRAPALVVLVVVLTACGWGDSASPVPGPLVTVETRGGECPQGPCGRVVAIERNGRAHQLTPEATELGFVPAPFVVALDRAVQASDFEAILARRFTGECPVNFDGQEVVYTFAATTGPVRVASCEVEVDPGHPLFAAVDAALGSVDRP